MPGSYIPSRGDLVWLEFSPQSGHEQAGRRPALVISPNIYNEKAGLALFCPITSQVKGYPFELALPKKVEVSGVILCDQIRSLDWKRRHAKKIGKVSASILEAAIELIMSLIV